MNRRVPNGTHGGVRGRKFLVQRNFLLLDYMTIAKKKKQAASARPDPDADYEDEDNAGYELPEEDGDETADEDVQVM